MQFRLEFECTAADEQYVYKIADELMRLFGVDASEAAGRINGYWGGKKFLSESDVLALLHNDPDHWARVVYFGHDGLWRSRVEGPQPPLPYP